MTQIRKAQTPPTALVDIGANLAHESFAADLDAVLDRADNVGVRQIVVTGSDEASAQAARAMACERSGQLYSTAGLHPHHASDFSDDMLAVFRALANTPQCVAIGETGLDFFRDISPRADQARAFEAHLALASELNMPLFLHQRDAHDRFLPMLRDWRHRLGAVVVHCFTDRREALFDYLDLDCHIGITGWVCDERRGQDLFASVPSVPADRLMIETDAPYLMPRTIRPRPKTRRNEPAHLPYVLETVARARRQSPQTVAQQTTANARTFFGLPQPTA
jgi:TatD DNase family protein